MKYTYTIDGMNTYASDSRDSKKHLEQHGGNVCTVCNKSGNIVSESRRAGDGTVYRCAI